MNIKIKYRTFHFKDKTVMRPSNFYDMNSYTNFIFKPTSILYVPYLNNITEMSHHIG